VKIQGKSNTQYLSCLHFLSRNLQIQGKIDSAEERQEYCGNCNEPVKSEWKACPLCGEFLDEYEARGRNDSTFTPQSLGFKSFKDAANRQTIDIMDRHREMRMNQLFDAMNRMDSSFYYGYTAINNSSRLMITQQELNYQADKLARFFVDGARPVIIKKNSNAALELSPDGFMGVIARAVIPEAGKMPPERQVALLLEDLSDPKGSKYLKYGKELLAFTESNKEIIGKLRGYKTNRKQDQVDQRAIAEGRYQEAVASAETDQDLFSAFTKLSAIEVVFSGSCSFSG